MGPASTGTREENSATSPPFVSPSAAHASAGLRRRAQARRPGQRSAIRACLRANRASVMTLEREGEHEHMQMILRIAA
jgi:hypothetical protein